MQHTVGIIIGKFLPPHNGHRYLIDFARSYVDRLIILICSLPWESIPGKQRYNWLRDMFPGTDIMHVEEEIPAARRDQPGATAIWTDTIRRTTKPLVDKWGPIEILFASETYGAQLAQHLGCRYVAVDPQRQQFPISGSQILADPYRWWHYLLPPVRRHFLKRVAIIGPNATTLARRLARRFNTVATDDYWAIWHQQNRGLPQPDDLAAIMRAQQISQTILEQHARGVLLCVNTPRQMAIHWQAHHDTLTPFLHQAVADEAMTLYLIMPSRAEPRVQVPYPIGTTICQLPAGPRAQFKAIAAVAQLVRKMRLER